MSHSKPGLDKLFQSELLKVMKDVMATSDIVRYRIYEVCSTVCQFWLLYGFKDAEMANLYCITQFLTTVKQQQLVFMTVGWI